MNFYAACNSVFMHVSNIADIALLTVKESFSFCVLMYAVPALT